jgi:hypothetical protein
MATTKKQPRKKSAAKTGRPAAKKTGSAPKWSANVTQNSNALDLDKGVFTSNDPDKIAKSLEHSAEKSKRKKAGSYQSAMSMLNFYINRAGKNLPAKKKATLTKAKDKLKELHNRKTGG